MIWLLSITLLLYAILIIALSVGFTKTPYFKYSYTHTKTAFSIVIPFRNEANNLPFLLDSIHTLKYPKELVEFIFVDDDSSDNSVAIINNYQLPYSFKLLKNVRTSGSPKKDAIATAILKTTNNWIITTDADCVLPKKWLSTLDAFIQEKQPKMVVAPVNYNAKNTLLAQFQLLDFMSMQGTTIGGFGIQFPFLCNGANLAYQKDVFLQLNGFKGNDTIASGDDIFLFEKFINHQKESVLYLKSEEATVTTFPVKTWTDLVQQRTRWAAKTSNFNSFKVKLIGLLILVTNTIVLPFWWTNSLKAMFFVFAVKMGIDLLLLIPTMRFFKHTNKLIKWYLFASFLYPFFSVYVVILSLTTKYSWKGRRFKK